MDFDQLTRTASRVVDATLRLAQVARTARRHAAVAADAVARSLTCAVAAHHAAVRPRRPFAEHRRVCNSNTPGAIENVVLTIIIVAYIAATTDDIARK